MTTTQAMTQAMTKAPTGNALTRYDEEQLNILRTVLCPNLTNAELAFFATVCQRMELDPFAKEIYVTKTKVRGYNGQPDTEKVTWMVGIDGYLTRAESTGEFEGTTAPQWCGKDGVWREVWLEDTPPAACRVGVWRKGRREPAWGIARYDSFVQLKEEWIDRQRTGRWLPSGQWARAADNMLRKCALAQAIRLAFPRQTGDTLTPDELDTREVVDEMTEGKADVPSSLTNETPAARGRGRPPGSPNKPKAVDVVPEPVEPKPASPPAAAAAVVPDPTPPKVAPVVSDPTPVAKANEDTLDAVRAIVEASELTDAGWNAATNAIERLRAKKVGTVAERNALAARLRERFGEDES